MFSKKGETQHCGSILSKWDWWNCILIRQLTILSNSSPPVTNSITMNIFVRLPITWKENINYSENMPNKERKLSSKSVFVSVPFHVSSFHMLEGTAITLKASQVKSEDWTHPQPHLAPCLLYSRWKAWLHHVCSRKFPKTCLWCLFSLWEGDVS